MGAYDSHVIVMEDKRKLDINQEKFEIISELLKEKPKPEILNIGENIVFTRHIMAIRRKGEWSD